MPKNKRPPARKSNESAEDKSEALAQQLCDLAIDLANRKDNAAIINSLQQKDDEFHKLIRKSLYQKMDEVLYDALERAQFTDVGAYRLLKDSIEEASATIVVRRDERAIEVNAFVIPLFAHSVGGLKPEQCFQDQQAFGLLTDSFKAAQLESADAKVVLISHAYHLDEIDHITYTHLNEMVLEALSSMTDKKMMTTPAIDRSITGWPDPVFGPEDQAVELRFLLGFALKAVDDPFYQVPDDEAAADAYFCARAERFQQWAEHVTPLVKRCLTTEGAEVDVNFLYQDLFHGGKETGIAEYLMLQMMSELNHALDQRGVMASDVKAVIGPVEIAGEMILRVNLYAATDGALLASYDKPLGVGRDLEIDIADMQDALMTIGVKAVSLSKGFDVEGNAVDLRAYDA